MMEEAEKSITDATDEVLELDKFKDVDKISAEMYNILSQYCTGEALTMVKSVTTFEGFLALREESFPIPLKYIDVTRTTHTNLDVKQEKRIDDYWNIDGS